MNKYKIVIQKKNEVWTCDLMEVFDVNTALMIQEVESDSFSGLMIEIGNKNWIDLINKNE